MLNSISTIRRYSIIALLCIIPVLIQAQNGDSKNNGSTKTYYPSTLVLVPTQGKISFSSPFGKDLYLPIYKKIILPNTWINEIIDIQQTAILTVEDRHEILSLSHKLGVRIRNPQHLALYKEAASWLGTRYRWAGNTKKGIDCSGLTGALVKNVYDKDIDRVSSTIAENVSETLDKENLEPGDLVFFATMRKKRINHVGVYLGDGQFIHASRRGVVVSSLEDGYYAKSLRKAGRI